jgi:predicted nucleotidyltransferase
MVTQDVFKVPPINQRKRIPMRVIRALANQIARKFSPDEIILFGSYAYGKPSPWSDVDLLVVMDTPRGELETSLEIVESLPPILFSLDILARNRQAIDQRTAMGDPFMREITSKGKMLYARNRQ